MISAVKEVMNSFSLEHPPQEMLPDGMMSTGENLAQCNAFGIDLYSPIKMGPSEDNPAIRKESKPIRRREGRFLVPIWQNAGVGEQDQRERERSNKSSLTLHGQCQ